MVLNLLPVDEKQKPALNPAAYEAVFNALKKLTTLARSERERIMSHKNPTPYILCLREAFKAMDLAENPEPPS